MSGRGLLAARWIALCASVAATVLALVLARVDVAGEGAVAADRYRCPMHPAVSSLAPGTCPICEMALQRVAPGQDLASPRNGLEGPPPTEAARAGAYTVRSVAFNDDVRVPAWVESPGVLVAHLYVDEFAMLDAGARGTFTAAGAPDAHLGATLSADPSSEWDGCTDRVRARLDTAGPSIEVGTTGWLRFGPMPRRSLLVPISAIVQTSDGPHVLVAADGHAAWDARPVELGKAFFGHAVVVAGLRERESVAVDGLFFLDAERRLRAGGPAAIVDSAR